MSQNNVSKRFRLLLLIPEANIHRLNVGPLRMSFREAPLTLTTLAALVPPELDVQIRIVDENVEAVPADEPFDLVGISCLTGTAFRAYQWADHFRVKGSTVVLGGIHATLRPDEAQVHADAIVLGFAEQTWPQLLRDFVRGCMKKRYESNPLADLSGLPIPRRDLQRRLGYMAPNTVFATRGCKRSCDFCTVPTIPFGWQTRPVGEVIDEIRNIPAKRIAFNDVNLTEDREYAKALFKAMLPLKKKWGGLATVDMIEDDEMLKLMAHSGCVYLLLGLETLSDSGLDGMRKRFNRQVDYRTAMAKLHELSIIVQGCFIFGLDSDDRTVFERTVEAVNELQVDIPRFAIYTPYPETPAFQRLKKEGRILHEHWPHYDTQHVVFQPARMSVEELDRGFRWAYRQAFSLGSIASRALHSKQMPITFLGNLAYRLYIRRLQSDPTRIYQPNPAVRRQPCHT